MTFTEVKFKLRWRFCQICGVFLENLNFNDWKKISNVFFSITPDIKEFCIGEFLPELRLATVNFTLPQDEFLRLEGNTYSTLIKLLYAFLWQVINKNTNIYSYKLMKLINWQVSSVFDDCLTTDWTLAQQPQGS